MARETCLSIAEVTSNSDGVSPKTARGFSTMRSTSSCVVFCRACTTYLRRWQTKNPCSSKYSRTIVSSTADIDRLLEIGVRDGIGHDCCAEPLQQHKPQLALA